MTSVFLDFVRVVVNGDVHDVSRRLTLHREQQAGIVRLEHGARVTDQDRRGKEVHRAATSEWLKALLREAS
jgi:hypothetical protein